MRWLAPQALQQLVEQAPLQVLASLHALDRRAPEQALLQVLERVAWRVSE